MKSKLHKRLVAACWRGIDIDVFVGIDTSKKHLDVCLLSQGTKVHSKRFDNDASGFAELVRWCSRLAALDRCHFCLESTGCYGFGIASWLSDAGHLVSVENPRTIKHFAIGEGIQNKTDKADAGAIALYCKKKAPRPWALTDPKLRELDLLVKRLTNLEQAMRRESNRLEDPWLPMSVQQSIRASIASHQEHVAAILKTIAERLGGMPEQRAMIRALVREPGVGERTAIRVLCHFEWGVTKFEGAQQAAAAAGLNPVLQQSGQHCGKTKISKHGPAGIRADIYMAAVSASSWNPVVRTFYEKLKSRGMQKHAAVVACARKLIMRLFGILKAHLKGTPPSYGGDKRRFLDLQGKQVRFTAKAPIPLTI